MNQEMQKTEAAPRARSSRRGAVMRQADDPDADANNIRLQLLGAMAAMSTWLNATPASAVRISWPKDIPRALDYRPERAAIEVSRLPLESLLKCESSYFDTFFIAYLVPLLIFGYCATTVAW